MKIFITIALSLLVIGCGDRVDGNGNGSGNNSNMGSASSINLDDYNLTSLTSEQKHALAYMWNEERLAYDIYMNLNKLYPTNQLNNIATKSETTHISLVRDLVSKYDINITNLVDYKESYLASELDAMGSGVYGIQAIQDLYDTLYAEGASSQIDSLKVGCKVEVVDVDDLDKYIAISTGNQALIDTFNILRDGSYRHYWAFDSGLKALGINDGCCSLGDEFCKTAQEYPTS